MDNIGISSVSYAGFWKRVLASIIDSIVLLMAGFVLGLLLGFTGIFGPLTGSEEFEFELENIFSILIAWLYYALMESSSFQATLGKIALEIKVTDLEGKKLSFGKATARHFGKIISALVFSLGFLMIAFTRKKQGLHDIIAGTLVVCGKGEKYHVSNQSLPNPELRNT